MREGEASLQRCVLTMQVIAGALVAGSLTFLVVAVVLVQSSGTVGGTRPDDAPPILTWMAVGLLALVAVVSFLVPPMIERAGLARLAGGPAPVEAADLVSVYQVRMIVTLALFEGASFFGSIAYLMEGRPLALAVSAAAIAAMLTRFPSEWGLNQWLSERKGELAARRARPKP